MSVSNSSCSSRGMGISHGTSSEGVLISEQYKMMLIAKCVFSPFERIQNSINCLSNVWSIAKGLRLVHYLIMVHWPQTYCGVGERGVRPEHTPDGSYSCSSWWATWSRMGLRGRSLGDKSYKVRYSRSLCPVINKIVKIEDIHGQVAITESWICCILSIDGLQIPLTNHLMKGKLTSEA